MEATKIIEDLGGKHVVSEFTGAKPNAVTQWRRIGIPARYWPDFMEAAAGKIPNLTFEDLRATKPVRG